MENDCPCFADERATAGVGHHKHHHCGLSVNHLVTLVEKLLRDELRGFLDGVEEAREEDDPAVCAGDLIFLLAFYSAPQIQAPAPCGPLEFSANTI